MIGNSSNKYGEVKLEATYTCLHITANLINICIVTYLIRYT